VTPLRLTVRAFGPFAKETVVDYRELGDRSFFLICGPTGAGKTTLLDAKAFALFGKTSGGDRDPQDMRSQHADPDRMTEVVFDFALGPEAYRIRRVPRQYRPAIRGTKLVQQIPKATLWKRTGVAGDVAEGEVLADGWDEVTRKVEELVGFTVEQFRQVILLPQGEFRRFLSANSSDREKILEALFHTESYRRIEEALKESSRKLESEGRDLRVQEETILQGESAAGREELEARKAADQIRADGLAVWVAELRIHRQSLERELAEARETARRLAEEDAARREVETFERGLGANDARRRTIQVARKALPLATEERVVRARGREADAAERDRRDAKAAQGGAAAERERTAQALLAERARDGERLDLAERVRGLEEIRQRVLELVALRKKASASTSEIERLEGLRRGIEAEVEKAGRLIEKKRASLAEAEALAPQAVPLKALLADASRRTGDCRRLEEERRKIAPLQEAHRDAGQSAEDLDREVQKRRLAVEALETAWVRGQAAVLAAGLEPGKPCAVCGSTVHPAPARASGGIPGEAELRTAKAGLRALEECRKGVLQTVSTAFERLSQAQASLRALEESVAGGDAEEFALREGEIRAKYDRARVAAGSAPALALEIAALATARQSAQSRIEEVDGALRQARTELDGAASLVRDREAAVPAGFREVTAVERKIVEVRIRAAGLQAGLEKAEQAARGAAEEFARAEARSSAAEKAARESAELAVQAAARFDDAMRLAGFGSVRDYESARRTPEEIEQFDSEARKFEGDLRAARTRLERAAAEAKARVPKPAGPIEEELRHVQSEEDRAVRDETAARRDAERLGRSLSEIARLAARRDAVEREYAVLGRLSQVANGQNPERLTLQRFVLRSLLQEVLAVASRRLSAMSRGRYALQVARAGGEVRWAGGLELEVQDAWSGTARAVATLSGGEGFLASLALALGLADVVQSRAGGIRLDTVFVDEGFGTLDEEALDLAIDTLMSLREHGRRVGIISHVRELKERIDTRLEVAADRDTSSARFVLS
jgi:exonuclease SbcC